MGCDVQVDGVHVLAVTDPDVLTSAWIFVVLANNAVCVDVCTAAFPVIASIWKVLLADNLGLGS